MIKVLFFARLREQLGCETVDVDYVGLKTVEDLHRKLIELHPEWANALNDTRLLIAVNQTLVKNEHLLSAGDEVALFPPVTGG